MEGTTVPVEYCPVASYELSEFSAWKHELLEKTAAFLTGSVFMIDSEREQEEAPSLVSY